jgi:hypothetical protein
LFGVAIDGWDEEADVLRERVGVSVLRGPVFSDKLVDLIVEKLRTELVIGRGWNAGDSIVRGIDGRVFSLGFLEGEGGFFKLNRKGLKEDMWDIWCVAEEGEGNVIKDDVWDVFWVERDVRGMSEPGGEPGFGLVRGEFKVGIGVSGIKVWLLGGWV